MINAKLYGGPKDGSLLAIENDSCEEVVFICYSPAKGN